MKRRPRLLKLARQKREDALQREIARVKKEADDLETARQMPIRALETGSPIRFVSAATTQNLSKEGIAASSEKGSRSKLGATTRSSETGKLIGYY